MLYQLLVQSLNDYVNTCDLLASTSKTVIKPLLKPYQTLKRVETSDQPNSTTSKL